jgi:hypothetical protein
MVHFRDQNNRAICDRGGNPIEDGVQWGLLMEVTFMSAVRSVALFDRASPIPACQIQRITEKIPTEVGNWTFDHFVQSFKWPLAVCSAVATPLLLWSLFRLAACIVTGPTFGLLAFALGILGFFLFWRRWLGASRVGAALISLEREFTRALFALVTGHSILGFRATLGRGAEVRFSGRGNWIISVAPFFFPTAAIFLFLMAFFLPFASMPWQSLMLGVALGFQAISRRREIFRDQNDLRPLGPLFCWMFLPAANLAVMGLLVSFAYAGITGVSMWLWHLFEPLASVIFLLS